MQDKQRALQAGEYFSSLDSRIHAYLDIRTWMDLTMLTMTLVQ